MKLYYDNLISFMPTKIIKAGDTEATDDPKLMAARQAMIALADFQNNQNVLSLYQSVGSIAVYAGVDIVSLILSLGDVQVEQGGTEALLDIAAKNLFKTVISDPKEESFDHKYYAAILLTVAHNVMEMQRKFIMEVAELQKHSDEDSAKTEKE